jgi:hypothetical protein
MEQYEQIPFNRAKAEAWVELYPILKQTESKGSFFSKFTKRDSERIAKAVRRYLGTLVQRRIDLFRAAPFLPREDALDGWLDETLSAAVQHANHQVVEEMAAKFRIDLLNIVKYAYHAELDLRLRRAQQFPVHSVNYESDEEERIRAEWKAIGDQHRAEAAERELHEQAAVASAEVDVPSPPEPERSEISERQFEPGETAKRMRALTVAKLIKELNDLRPQMFEDEAEYARLRHQYPEFLTFKIAEERSDLRMKIIAIRGSTRHIRLAQELAAAHHGRQLSTIQDDWKNFKPTEFKRPT